MRKKRIELDVDSIGTQGTTLTKEEENIISDYIRAYKPKKRPKSSKDKIIA
jgi:hypothetical protein